MIIYGCKNSCLRISNFSVIQLFVNDCIGSWSNWSECSSSCGNATKSRNRTCLIDCENRTVEYKECNLNCCKSMSMYVCVYMYGY